MERDKSKDDNYAAPVQRAISSRGTPGKGSRTHDRYAGVPAPPVQRLAEPTVQRKAGGDALYGQSRPMPAYPDMFGGLLDMPVQLATTSDGERAPASEDVQRIAARGVQGSGGALPHLAQIQQSFGAAHDLGGIQAHVGGEAAVAGKAIGAAAYATGNKVAFNESPDLHTAAHEAAHVVQQRAGVQLLGGVGKEGDSYEQNADAVADRVVAGESAQDLLPGFGASRDGDGVQRKAADVQRKDGDVQRKGGKKKKKRAPLTRAQAEKQGVRGMMTRSSASDSTLTVRARVNRGSARHVAQHWIPRFTTSNGNVFHGKIISMGVRAGFTKVTVKLPNEYKRGGPWDKEFSRWSRVFAATKQHAPEAESDFAQVRDAIENWNQHEPARQTKALLWLFYTHLCAANKVFLKPAKPRTKAEIAARKAADTAQTLSLTSPVGRARGRTTSRSKRRP